ncbi:MAG: sarcosine oxidase subunit delta [Paracoccaceae bacterium]
MRIPCPLCGPRDRREFYYYGSDDYLNRPAEGAAPEAWDDYLHLRDNPAGPTRDLWYHELGCSAWIEVHRNTVTHEIMSARLVADGAEPGGDSPRKKPRKTAGEAAE